MRCWESLTEKQRLELGWLFCYGLPPEVDLQFEAMKKNNGDAMPFVEYVKKRWDKIHEIRRTGVENFRDAYQRAAGMTQDPEQRNPDPFGRALFVWYDEIMYQGRILKVADSKIVRVEIFDLLKPRGRPRKRPTTAEVAEAARKLVHQTPERYKRQRLPSDDQPARSSEQLVRDLVEHFRKEGIECGRRTIMRRLSESDFSLEKEFPDLAFPLREE